jgi:uncharacterized protein (TIGR03435 family)
MRNRAAQHIVSAMCVLLIIVTHTFSREVLAQVPEAFEVASIKPLGEANAAALARFGDGCDGGFPRVDRNRFTVSTTVYALMTWAYGFNKNGGCSFVSYGGFISGGPKWIRSERFEIQALLPQGLPEYTTGQFLNGEAPKLEVLIKNLLAERFHLAIHREMKEVPGYVLVAGKDGPKIRASKETDAPAVSPPAQRRTAAPSGSQHAYSPRTTMTYVALMLGVITRRPVLDQTGLTGDFILDLEYAAQDAPVGNSSAPSVFTAVQEQLGLKLESAKVPAEVLVIDRAEKPSEN